MTTIKQKSFFTHALGIVLSTVYPIGVQARLLTETPFNLSPQIGNYQALTQIGVETNKTAFLGQYLNSRGGRGKIEFHFKMNGANGTASVITKRGDQTIGQANLRVTSIGTNAYKMSGILNDKANGGTWNAEAVCNFKQNLEKNYKYLDCNYSTSPRTVNYNGTVTGEITAIRHIHKCRTVPIIIPGSPRFGSSMGMLCGYYPY